MTDLPEKITYWTISDNNDGTGVGFNPGVVVDSRTATHSDLIVDENGKELRTRFAVYAEVLIPVKSYIFLGEDLGSVSPHSEAREVIATSENITMTELRRMLI